METKIEQVVLKDHQAGTAQQTLDGQIERMRLVNIEGNSGTSLEELNIDSYWDNLAVPSGAKPCKLQAMYLNNEQLLKNEQINDWLLGIPDQAECQYSCMRPLRHTKGINLSDYVREQEELEDEQIFIMFEDQEDKTSGKQPDHVEPAFRRQNDERLSSGMRNGVMFEIGNTVLALSPKPGQQPRTNDAIKNVNNNIESIDSSCARTPSMEDDTYIIKQVSDDLGRNSVNTFEQSSNTYDAQATAELDNADCKQTLKMLWNNFKQNIAKYIANFKQFMRTLAVRLRMQPQNIN